MRLFTFRPALTVRGRKFKGLRGWAGKPLHPPLTDVPIGAYLIAPVLDVWSRLAVGAAARELYRAAAYVLVIGLVVAVPTVLTGVWDWLKSTPRRTQAWRTTNAHAVSMALVNSMTLASVLLRFGRHDAAPETPGGLVALSVAALVVAAVGGALGGSLVYDYGFNVETSGDHPVWHESEADVFPGTR